MTYEIRNAALLVRNGADFIATNTDATFPHPARIISERERDGRGDCDGFGKEPLVIGKPFTAMYEHAYRVLNLNPHQVMGVGDRLKTDISGAQRADACPGGTFRCVHRPGAHPAACAGYHCGKPDELIHG